MQRRWYIRRRVADRALEIKGAARIVQRAEVDAGSSRGRRKERVPRGY